MLLKKDLNVRIDFPGELHKATAAVERFLTTVTSTISVVVQAAVVSEVVFTVVVVRVFLATDHITCHLTATHEPMLIQMTTQNTSRGDQIEILRNLYTKLCAHNIYILLSYNVSSAC